MVLRDANDPLFGLIEANKSPLAKQHKGLCSVGVWQQSTSQKMTGSPFDTDKTQSSTSDLFGEMQRLHQFITAFCVSLDMLAFMFLVCAKRTHFYFLK